MKTFKEVFIILTLSLVIGLIANAISSKGISLVRDDSERFTIDSTKKSVNLKERGKLNKAGFYQPVNIPVEAAKLLYDENIKFIDGRPPEEFRTGHIKGAYNISYKEFIEKSKEEKLEMLKDFGKDEILVSYCGSDSCEISIDNAYEFAKVGYNDVKIYLGGYKEWNNLGYPVEK